jgi:hypothetical protein
MADGIGSSVVPEGLARPYEAEFRALLEDVNRDLYAWVPDWVPV